MLLLNKYDLDERYAERIAENLGVEVLGRVRYDEAVAEAYASMTPLLARAPPSPAGLDLVDAFEGLVGRWL